MGLNVEHPPNTCTDTHTQHNEGIKKKQQVNARACVTVCECESERGERELRETTTLFWQGIHKIWADKLYNEYSTIHLISGRASGGEK